MLILEVALEGMNRSEIPMSMELTALKFLRLRDNKSVVPFVPAQLLALSCRVLLMLLFLLKNALLLLFEVVSCRVGEVEGKKNRPGAPPLLCIVSIETIELGRKIIEESHSLPILGLEISL